MAGKKKEKGSPSAIIGSAAVAVFCIAAAAADFGFPAIVALVFALVSLGVNVNAFLKKKKAGGGSKASPVSPVRAESAPRRERKNEMPDAVPVRKGKAPAYSTRIYDSPDYTRRRMEQLQRFLDAGLIDKAEYETEKRKIREGR